MPRAVSSIIPLWAAVTTILSGCPAAPPAPKVPVARAPAPIVQKTGRPETTMSGNANGELELAALSAGVEATSGVTISDLPPAETAALIARMEPLPAGPNELPAVRPPSARPPGPGTVQPIAFAAASGASVANHAVTHGPPIAAVLEAPQILPVGEVAMESEIRVRFTEPMVAVDKLGPAPELATFEPPIAGSWKWTDTRVAVFTAKAARLAQATDYKVTVKPGIKALSGAVLGEAATGAFSTPPVTLVSTFPNGPQRADAPIAIQFSQDIDERAIVPFLHVFDHRNRPVPFVLGDLVRARSEWAKNPRNESDHDGLGTRYVLIAPMSRWEAGATFTVRLEKRAPSHEGPRLARESSQRTFTIAPVFRATGIGCEEELSKQLAATCPAASGANVTFSNPLDALHFRAAMVQIAGQPLEDHDARGNSVRVIVPDAAGKTFAIDLRGDLRDAYGQELEGAHRVSITASRLVYEPDVRAVTGLYVLDPRYQVPQYVIETQAVKSLHVELYKVQPSDYFAYQQLEEGKRTTPPGTRISARDVVVGDRYAGVERLDLRPALSAAGTGHVVIVTRAVLAAGQRRRSWVPAQLVAWAQVTKLGVITRVDQEAVHAWVDDISHAHFLEPRTNVATRLVIENRPEVTTAAATDAQGEATLALPAEPPPPKLVNLAPPSQLALVVARDGDDSVFTALDRSARTERVRNAEWYVTDDRFTYKPGEPVYMKGWVRWTHNGVNPGLELPAAGERLAYDVFDARQNKVASGTTTLTDQGGFDFQVELPANTNLGSASVVLRTRDQQLSHRISVQEFRTPAYSVNLNDDVQASGIAPLFLGDAIEMNAEAKYYAGGGLGGAAVKWDATLQNASFRPPGWDRYAFDPVKRHDRYDYQRPEPVLATTSTTLGGGSNSLVRLALHALPAGEPAVLSVDATVTDVDRQTIRASSRKILVHPASYYVGMRLREDTRDQLQVVVSDVDGNAVPGIAVEVKLDAMLYSEGHFLDPEIHATQTCAVKSAREPAICKFTPSSNPDVYYRAIAELHDARGRVNRTQYAVPYWRPSETTEALSITADRRKYAVGETAKLTIHSSEIPATAMVSFSRQGIIEQHRIELRHHDEPFELKMDVSYLENVVVEVDRIAKRQTEDKVSPDPLPAHLEASIDLEVDLDASRLQIVARPGKPLVQPGEDATFEVDVARDGTPVANAEVALIVVDEAVLALSGMHHADPMAPFYQTVEAGTAQANSFDAVEDEDENLLGVPGFTRINLDDNPGYGAIGHGSGTGSGFGAGSGRGGMSGMASSTTVTARKDFRATALFAPRLHTDAKGHASVRVKMPESLTRFRVVALASAQTYFFGKGEGTIVTQRKVNARTQAPRFLAQGDRFELPVVVQNLDATARTIEVAVRAANLAGGGGKRVVVPAGQRAEVRFPFSTLARGNAVIQTIVTSGTFTDASNVTVPVYVPATTETFATYGTVDTHAAYEQLNVPGDIFPDVGGVETEVASTQLQTLTDAYWYLRGYPYECAEQRSSRMLATAAMANVLDAFALPGRQSPQEQAAIQAADVRKLEADQNRDGGWGYWHDTKSDPFVTMQVTTALHGLHASPAAQKSAIAYVTRLLTATTARLATAHHADPVQAEIALAATALATLASTGLDEKPAAQRLHDLATKLDVYPVDAKARLLAIVAKAPGAKAMRAKLTSDLVSATHETAAGATVTASYTESEKLLLVSNNRTTALVLDALIREAPEQPLIMKLARGLLAARAHGRWRSTQENLAVLQAMARYFAVYEKDVPDYTGKLWIGDVAYAEQAFHGRSNVRATAKLDWTKLVPGSQHAIAVEKTGPGRMYYRIGITYAPKRIDLPALDSGFVVRRSYEAVEHPDDVQKTATGYRIKLGARVLVTVEALNTTRRDGVALVDPLPAGLEAVNTNLAIAERAATGAISADWEHLETRDDRTEAFAGTLSEGSHVLSYTARATTPGTFNAAPATAEEMYSPETFGRSQGAIVTVY